MQHNETDRITLLYIVQATIIHDDLQTDLPLKVTYSIIDRFFDEEERNTISLDILPSAFSQTQQHRRTEMVE